MKVVAIYDYTNRVEGDVSFRKGDIMILMDTRQVFFQKIYFKFCSNKCFNLILSLICF